MVSSASCANLDHEVWGGDTGRPRSGADTRSLSWPVARRDEIQS